MKKKSNSTSIILTRAFCFGEDRQHMTVAQLLASLKNDFSKPLPREYSNDLPSIINPNEKLSFSVSELSFGDLICKIPSSICFSILS
jgi:hypothetical protein